MLYPAHKRKHLVSFLLGLLAVPWLSHAVSWHPRDEVYRDSDFNGVSVAQVLGAQSGTLMYFDHYILIEMEVDLLQMTDDDWDRLAEYFKASYYSYAAEGCGKDEAVTIDNVIMNPHYVPFADGIANFTDYIRDGFNVITVPVLLEMSCVECDPDLVVVLQGFPDLPGADRRLHQLGSSNKAHHQQQPEQQEDKDIGNEQKGDKEHRRLTGLLPPSRESNKFFCEPGDNFGVTLDFYTQVTNNPGQLNIDPVGDIFYVADIPTKVEDCWENYTIQEFEYTMYFNANTAPSKIFSESGISLYGDLFTRVYNEVNARDWRRCDSEGRVATWAEITLPEEDWAEGIITWEVTFYGYCVNCVPQGCLFENDPAEGWPAVIEELPDRPVSRPSRSSPRNNNNNNIGDTTLRGGRNERNPTRDEYEHRKLHAQTGNGNNFGYEYPSLSSSSSVHRRLAHVPPGVCLCNEYAYKNERPSFQEFSDKLSEIILFVDIPVYFVRILEVWEADPEICNTCCGWSDDQVVTFTDRDSLFAATNEIYNAGGTDTAMGVGKAACWDVSGVEDFGSIWGGFDIPLNVDLSCWDVSNGISFTDTFGGSIISNVGDIGKWNISSAETLSGMFHTTVGFNFDISGWDFPSATDLSYMFAFSESFNVDISVWDVSRIENLSQMFVGSLVFDQSLADWDPSSATNFIEMFAQSMYNQPLGNWTFAQGAMLDGMFFESIFNNEISGWDVSGVTSMPQMFELNFDFNQPLTGWNTSSCENFLATFASTDFNQPLDHFDISNGITFEAMFYDSFFFNHPLDSWAPVSGENFYTMFALAESFNQNLCHWTTIISQDNVDNGGINALVQMFAGTSCPEEGPVLGVDQGPYCFSCV